MRRNSDKGDSVVEEILWEAMLRHMDIHTELITDSQHGFFTKNNSCLYNGVSA